MPCVIYLHGNCSSRVDALSAAQILLPMDITVFAFDFSGCGNSEGEWVTLGYKEQEDLQTVINHLRSIRTVSLIGLWGRSMGAVTSIFYTAKEPAAITAMVLDSPFSSLHTLTLELVRTYSKIPVVIARILMKFLRKSILSRTGMDIEKLNPIDHVAQCFIPSVFIMARGDDFVNPHHGEDMYQLYGGDKNLIYVEGDHNSERPPFMNDSVSIFFHNAFQSQAYQTDDEPELALPEISVLHPVITTAHISNEDYLFKLDRTLVAKHRMASAREESKEASTSSSDEGE